MTNLRLLLGSLALLGATTVMAQGARNIVINEVMTSNTQSIEDEFGQREAWIELANTSFSTYNVRGMYVTTNPAALDPSLSAPERIALMSVIPNGDDRTSMGARKHLLLFCNSDPAKGRLHLSVPVSTEDSTLVALFNGNGIELIDQVMVPPLQDNESYARINGQWQVVAPDQVTPGHSNKIQRSGDVSKIDQFKENDPHGFAMALMAMGIVFLCLALLWLFFTVFGIIMRHVDTAKKVANKQPIKPITKTVETAAEIGHKTSNILQEGLDKRGIDMEVYMAVIGMALRQYEDDVHDVESGIITIKPKDTGWDDEYSLMTHFHEPIVPTSHAAPHIPTTPELH
ncbi:MAG: OadG family protein [Prevotella sp.]|nr:OadG family protein [Prevotella sp.]